MIARHRLVVGFCAPLLAWLVTAGSAAAQPPGAPTLTSALGSGGYTFTWQAVPNATWYYLWVNDSSGPKYTVWYTKEEAGCPAGTGSCVLYLVMPPMLNGQGTWYVQSWNGSGSAWAAGQNFITRPLAPYVVDSAGRFTGTLLDQSRVVRDVAGLPAEFTVFANGIYLINEVPLFYLTNNCTGQAFTHTAMPDRLVFTGAIGNGWITRSLPGLGPALRGFDSSRSMGANNMFSACDNTNDVANLMPSMPVSTINMVGDMGNLTPPFTVVR